MDKFVLDAASESYRQKREALRRAEIALKEQREQVAALRRELPDDTPLAQDYVFTEPDGDATRPVRLSELFEPDREALLVIHFMWAPENDQPCPMCTMWADGYNAAAPHVARTVPMVIIAKQDAQTLRTNADRRGWHDLRVLSSGGTSFNKDFGMEMDDGSQLPGVSVFLKGADGQLRHFYTGSALQGDDHYRGLDLLTPVWSMLDLLPNGRGDWFPSLSYDQ